MEQKKYGMKVLVTGSRDWNRPDLIKKELELFHQQQQQQQQTQAQPSPSSSITLIHGGCPTGADAMAHSLATSWGWTIHVFHAEWDKYGRKAGPLRNVNMVKQTKPDHALVFSKNGSSGTEHCYKCLLQYSPQTLIKRIEL